MGVVIGVELVEPVIRPNMADRAPGLPVIETPVDEPSVYAVHVFVISDAEASGMDASRSYVRLPYELQCEPDRHVCWEVSTAVFVSEAIAEDRTQLRDVLSLAVGLDAQASRLSE